MRDMINITVRPFGPAMDVLGSEPLEYSIVPPATLANLLELMFAKYPRLANSAASLRFAINDEYADASAELKEGDEVAIIPPVAGGASRHVILTREPIDATGILAAVEHPDCGGIVTFHGVVRAEGASDNPLAALEYSANESMAIKQMEQLRTDAIGRFAVHEVAIAHRLGRLAIGEASVIIAVSAPHRPDAFEACRWIIDTLKQDVPIWKKEVWSQGESTWVDPTHGK